VPVGGVFLPVLLARISGSIIISGPDLLYGNSTLARPPLMTIIFPRLGSRELQPYEAPLGRIPTRRPVGPIHDLTGANLSRAAKGGSAPAD
jgi:hypothetical protein